MSFWLRDGVDVSAGRAAASLMTARVGALSDAVVVRQSLVYGADADPREVAEPTSSTPRMGVFVFSTAEPTQFGIVALPSIRPEYLIVTGPGAGVLIDQAAPPVAAFVGALLAGSVCNPFAVPLLALEAAFLQLRP